MLEQRKLIADIDIDALLKNDAVANYSQGDTEEAYNAALQIFERECYYRQEYRIIEVTETGLDTYLLLLVFDNFDYKEKILGPDENNPEQGERFTKKYKETRYDSGIADLAKRILDMGVKMQKREEK